MIKGIIRNMVTLSLAVIVLIATSGFTIFKHSCRSEKTTEFSFLIPEFKCEHFQQAASLPACCCIPEENNDESFSNEKCCDTEPFLVKLNITTDVQDYVKHIPLSFSLIPVGEELYNNSEITEISHIIICNDLPPPISGKELCIFLNQLIIPFASV